MGLKIKIYKSIAGASKDQLATIRGLGLWRFGQSRILKDTPAIRGMVFKVQHLISQEVVKEEPPKPARKKSRRTIVRERAREAREKELAQAK
jgi:large subunit ribosomal protein L30